MQQNQVPPSNLLRKVLEADAKQCTTPKDIPGSDLPRVILEFMSKEDLSQRLEIFSALCTMYAKNEIAIQLMEVLTGEERYLQRARYALKRRRISERMYELIAIFYADNSHRETAGMRGYPIPTINPINKDITTKEQALRFEKESANEVQEIFKLAYPSRETATNPTDRQDRGEPTRATSPTFATNREPLMVRTASEGPGNSFVMPTFPTNRRDHQDLRNTVAFNTRPSSINQRLMNLANNSETATTATNCKNRPDETRGPHNREEYQPNNSGRSRRQHTSETPRLWENNSHCTCNSCGERGHIARECPRMDLFCNFCNTRTHNTAVCRTKPKSSTPLESPSNGNYHPTPLDTSIQPVVNTHLTQPSPTPSTGEECMKLMVTRLEQNNAESKEAANQSRYLDNIELFDGSDKTKCLPWVNRVQQAAACSSMNFRQALLAKAGTTVFGIVAATRTDIGEMELKQVILRNLSNIATPSEADNKLREMRMSPDQPIASFNYYYSAVHKAAFEITPEQQFMRTAREDYANSLPEYTASKLINKMVKANSYIKTLQDAMDQAVKIDQETRQVEVMRIRRNASSDSSDTTINTSVNEVSEFDINYVTAKRGDSRFNSTMKPGYHNRSFHNNRSSHNNTWHDNRGSNNSYNNHFRKINKYRHQVRDPKNNIRFEYQISRGEREIMSTLAKMIEYLKGKPEREIESIKHMPKFNPRGMYKVSEDSIATISMDELRSVLKEDVNTIYDTLVATDYIKEVTDV